MIEVQEVTPEVWRGMSENAHFAVFDETWDGSIERVDFALLMINKEVNEVVSYITVQIRAKTAAYIQWGGVFKKYRNTPMSFKSFIAMLEYLKSKFKTIVTLVENKNTPMLKFYMKEKFLITGIRYFKQQTFLEHQYEH